MRMSTQVNVVTQDNMLKPISNHNPYTEYNSRFSGNLGLNNYFVSTPNLASRCGSTSSSCSRNEGEAEEYDTTPRQSDIQMNHLAVPNHVANDTHESPRLRRARYKLSSLLNIKMASEASTEDGRKSPKPQKSPKSPKTPKVRTPSFFRKNSIFGYSTTEQQNIRSNLRSVSDTNNVFAKTQLKKTVSFPSQSLQDISMCGTPRISPRHRMSFSSTMFMHKITNEEEQREMFHELIRCIQTDDCKALKTIMKRKLIDTNSITENSFTLLHEASYKGCIKCMKILIKNGCCVDKSDESGWTALHASIFANQFDAVKFLLDNHAPVNTISSKGWTPLHLGVFVGDLYIVHELVRNGGDPLLCNDKNVSPFQLAINLSKSLLLDYFLHLPCFLVE